MNNKIETQSYIHIPFCAGKCSYCDFLSFPAGRDIQDKYVEALKREITGRSYENRNYSVRSIFFGGGTPSLLKNGKITELLKTLYDNYDVKKDAEISIEANPCTISNEKIKEYREAGINRISIGCQSIFDEQLKILGRIHSADMFYNALDIVKKAGFENINIDLMFGIPGLDRKKWLQTLENIASLGITHISAYSLILENGTRLYKEQDKYVFPDDETLERMYKDTADILSKHGIKRYEISNYSMDGYECIHNKGYWEHVRYQGFGLGASSFEDNSRFKNCGDIGRYIDHKNIDDLKEDIEKLNEDDVISEFIILGLRQTKGISFQDFEERFGKNIFELYEREINNHLKFGTLMLENGRIFIPEKYLFVSNSILSDFI